MPRLPRFAALVLCALLSLSGAARARDWRISNFDVTIEVQQDGSAFVSEQITFVFVGSFQGVRRYIPIDYPGPAGSNYTLFMRVTSVTDYDNSHPLKYELSKRGDAREIKIYIPNAADTTRKIEINYLVENATRFFPDHQEFYWNVTGTEWPVPIDRATALIVFPEKAAGSLRAVAFTGSYGSTARDATAQILGHKAFFETTNPLPMRSGLTADVYLPLDTLTAPPLWEKIWWFAASNPVVFLPLIAFVVMFTLWYWVGRDPDPGMSVAPMYEPPASLMPAEVGTLIDDKTDARDITSTLIDLAVRGYIRIEESPRAGLILHHRDYIFHSLKGINEWQPLRQYERVILEKFFGLAGTEVRLSEMNQHFYTALPMITDDILNGLKRKGMYSVDPEAAHLYWFGGILAIVGVVVGLQYAGVVQFFLNSVVGVVALAVSVGIVYLYGRVMTAKSLLGARTYIGILGFQDFMMRVDADRLSRMPMDTFEKFLPYAMALGIENRWAKAFSGLMQKPPQWYQPVDNAMFTNWNTLMFTNVMRTMMDDAHQTFVSAPRNQSTGSGFSGSGGFSGGGFSGGGFGGGGGSAF